jgi:SAM-dependent methyltransferase
MAIGMNFEQSHANSLDTLNTLNRYQDFIDNIATVADMGCGIGLDAIWWAKLTKQDGTPRGIKINAVDNKLLYESMVRHKNINYIPADFTNSGLEPNSQDFLMSHNSLQFSINPMQTLLHWWEIMRPDAMLLLTLPYNFTVDNHREIQKVNATYTNGCYFNWTMGNMIMMLAATGFDCRNSHFRFDRVGNWIQAAVYKLPDQPNPMMNWYEMCDRKMLPICMEQAIMKDGTFSDIDIVVEWIDRTQYMLSL